MVVKKECPIVVGIYLFLRKIINTIISNIWVKLCLQTKLKS